MYYCYLIYSQKKTYIGITNNFKKRIQQHNGLLSGGAKATRGYHDWKYFIIVSGFNNKSQAMRFEWLWKHVKNKNNKWRKTPSTIKMKIRRVILLLMDLEWKHIKIINHYL